MFVKVGGSRPCYALLAFALGGGPAACRAPEPEPVAPAPDVDLERPYIARRHAHETKLTATGPSPGKYADYEPPRGVVSVTYPSGELQLKAWYALPLGTSGMHNAPALVYFHGDFAFGPDDFEVVRPFVVGVVALLALRFVSFAASVATSFAGALSVASVATIEPTYSPLASSSILSNAACASSPSPSMETKKRSSPGPWTDASERGPLRSTINA